MKSKADSGTVIPNMEILVTTPHNGKTTQFIQNRNRCGLFMVVIDLWQAVLANHPSGHEYSKRNHGCIHVMTSLYIRTQLVMPAELQKGSCYVAMGLNP